MRKKKSKTHSLRQTHHAKVIVASLRPPMGLLIILGNVSAQCICLLTHPESCMQSYTFAYGRNGPKKKYVNWITLNVFSTVSS